MRLTLMICGIVMALGLVVYWNYVQFVNRQAADKDHLPVINHLERPLVGVDQKGNSVSFDQLQGKVWVLGYVYTRCPAGCGGVMTIMRDIQEEFADEKDRVHFVALSLDPEKDTPEHLDQWATEHQMGGDNWWFMTGDAKKIRSYMGKYFRMVVNKRQEQVEIYGEWEHEFKLALVDQAGSIRYEYFVLDARVGDTHREKLIKDIRLLLDNGPTFSRPHTKKG